MADFNGDESISAYSTVRRFTEITEITSDIILWGLYVGFSATISLVQLMLGTGHADTNKWEWLTNQHRDSSSSYLGHFDMLNYFSLAENEAKARVKFNLLEKMVQPCGPPPERVED